MYNQVKQFESISTWITPAEIIEKEKNIDIVCVTENDSMIIEGFFAPNKQTIQLRDCLVMESVFYNKALNDCSTSSMDHTLFKHCVFINIDFHAVEAWDCIFDNCLFFNVQFENYMFARNGNEIKNTISFDKEHYIKNLQFLIDFYPSYCPTEGSFIGWKKAFLMNDDGSVQSTCLIKLEIPEDAKRSSDFTHQCRANKANVLDIIDIKTNESIARTAHSMFDNTFLYEVGKIVTPRGEPFDENRFNHCSAGIHFFIDKESASFYF